MSEATVETRTRMTVDEMIHKYVAIRDRKKAIEEQQKATLQPYNEILSKLEGYMLEAMNTTGLNSMKSPHGTAYRTVRTSAKVIDWVQTLTYIREHNAWDLLEARVSKLAAQELIKETKLPIPGVETSSEVVVNVRRASAGTSE